MGGLCVTWGRLLVMAFVLAIATVLMPGATARGELPGLARRAFVPGLSADSAVQGALTRQLRIGAITSSSTHPAVTLTGTAGGDASYSLTFLENGLASQKTTVTVTSGATTVTPAAPPAGWTIQGYATVADSDGTANCSTALSYFPNSIVLASTKYLVCILYSFAAPAPQTRTVRVIKITSSTPHAGGTFPTTLTPVAPSGGFIGTPPAAQDATVTLLPNASTSVEALHTLTADLWTVSETAPASWRLDGYAVVADPLGNATCNLGLGFSRRRSRWGRSRTLSASAIPTWTRRCRAPSGSGR